MTKKQDNLISYQSPDTREIIMPDGSKRNVHMGQAYWDDVEFLRLIEGISTEEIAAFALEEITLQDNITFNRAFRNIVAHLGNRWT